MEGRKILQNLKGAKLQDGLVQSFFLNNKLSYLINVTFLKFDNKLIKIV